MNSKRLRDIYLDQTYLLQKKKSREPIRVVPWGLNYIKFNSGRDLKQTELRRKEVYVSNVEKSTRKAYEQ